MSRVIRIDDEVWRQLQERAQPLVDTPNDVLRRILKLDDKVKSPEKEVETKDSIIIVVNAAGKEPNESNAIACKELTEQRVKSGVDIQAPKRFSRARKILVPGTRIAMHQGGAYSWRAKYGSAQLIAAGTAKAVGLPLTEADKGEEDYALTKKYYPSKPLVGKAIYEFRCFAKKPLPKEDVSYNPGRGDNFIELKPDDPGYAVLDEWWRTNY